MPRPSATRGYARLAQKLILLDWLHQRLGYGQHRTTPGGRQTGRRGFRPGRPQPYPCPARLPCRTDAGRYDGRPATLRRPHPHPSGRDERRPVRACHAALFPIPGCPVHRNLSRPLLQPARRFVALVERIRPAAQREPQTQRTDPAVRCRRPVQAGLLDGNGQRQDAPAAPRTTASFSTTTGNRWTTFC